MVQLIINADDLGLTPGCNAGIVKAMTERIVSDTTLMTNTAYTEDAVARLKSHGITKAGLHLNLTFGKPLCPVSEVPSLVDEKGFFRRPVEQAVLSINAREAERELTSQVEKFLATGLNMTHLDGHHHVHGYPEILDIVIDLARQLQVPVRQSGETVRCRLTEAGVVTTDSISLHFYGPGATMENLRTIISNHHQGTLEIMCHPAEHDPLLYEISSYNVWRERELAVLTSPEMIRFIKEQGIALTGFDKVTSGLRTARDQ